MKLGHQLVGVCIAISLGVILSFRSGFYNGLANIRKRLQVTAETQSSSEVSEEQDPSLVNKWRSVVEAMSKKGSWYCSGTVSSPFMQINNEKVSYPIDSHAIEAMKTVALPAPFGKGTETVVDETVRKGLQIEPALVKFCNSESWLRKLDSIAQELRNAYQRDNITLKLYKMLLYD